jgi:protein required for attachment to host cells
LQWDKIMRKTTTLIVIANGSEAKFFHHEGRGKGLLAHPELNLDGKTLHARDIQADKPGRTFDRMGGQRHAMEYSSDPQDTALTLFARKITERLESTFQGSKFDRIIIAASPHMLAKLRKFLSPALGGRIYAQINKDLTQIPTPDLPSHFADVLAL